MPYQRPPVNPSFRDNRIEEAQLSATAALVHDDTRATVFLNNIPPHANTQETIEQVRPTHAESND